MQFPDKPDKTIPTKDAYKILDSALALASQAQVNTEDGISLQILKDTMVEMELPEVFLSQALQETERDRHIKVRAFVIRLEKINSIGWGMLVTGLVVLLLGWKYEDVFLTVIAEVLEIDRSVFKLFYEAFYVQCVLSVTWLAWRNLNEIWH